MLLLLLIDTLSFFEDDTPDVGLDYFLIEDLGFVIFFDDTIDVFVEEISDVDFKVICSKGLIGCDICWCVVLFLLKILSDFSSSLFAFGIYSFLVVADRSEGMFNVGGSYFLFGSIETKDGFSDEELVLIFSDGLLL